MLRQILIFDIGIVTTDLKVYFMQIVLRLVTNW